MTQYRATYDDIYIIIRDLWTDLDGFDEFPPEFIAYFFPDFVVLAEFFA